MKNLGAGPAGAGRAVDNVHVLDTLPTGLIPLGWSAEGNFTCQIFENPVNTVDCVGDMNPGDTFKITVHVFITQDGGTLGNQACIDPGNQFVESDESDNCKTKTTVIKKYSPNLSVQKSASSGTVTPGETFTYNITVSNIGDVGSGEPVTISDPLPSSVTVVGVPVATNGFTCNVTTAVECTDPGNGLPVGGTTTITIQATVNVGVTDPFENTASVAAAVADLASAPCSPDPSKCEDETAANQGNNSSTVSTSVGGTSIDLSVLSITDTPDPVNPGQGLEYTIVVVNGGTSSTSAIADPAQVKIELPQNGVSFVAADGTNGFNCTQSGSTVTCDGVFQGVGSAPANSTTITVRLTVDSVGAPQDLTLVAIADPTGKFVEPDEGNNTASAVTTVSSSVCSPNCIDLVMAQVLGSPDPVQVGGVENIVVELVNVGDTSTVNGAGDHVSVDVDVAGKFTGASALPAIALTNAPPDAFTCSLTTNVAEHTVYTCTGNLSAGAGVTLTFSATATSGSPQTIVTTATATLSGALYGDFDPGNNSASYTTNVVP